MKRRNRHEAFWLIVVAVFAITITFLLFVSILSRTSKFNNVLAEESNPISYKHMLLVRSEIHKQYVDATRVVDTSETIVEEDVEPVNESTDIIEEDIELAELLDITLEPTPDIELINECNYYISTIPETRINPEYIEMIDEVIQEYNYGDYLTTELVTALIELESDGDIKSTSSSNAKGLMQVMEIYWKPVMNLLGVDDLYDPKQNITVGCYILHLHMVEYEGDIWQSLMDYNAGEWGAQAARNGNYSMYAKIISKRSLDLTTLHRYKELLAQEEGKTIEN